MSGAYADHADFYRRGPFSQFLVEHRSAGSAPLELFTAAQPAGDYPDPAFSNVLLYLARRGTREARFDWGAGRWQGRWWKGDLTLVPPDSASDVTLSEPHEFLGLCVPRSALDRLDVGGSEAFTASLSALFERPFRDDFIVRLVEQLWMEADGDNPHGSLFADGVMLALLARLATIARAPRGQGARHPLPAYKLARVIDYVDAHLDVDLSVAQLAAVADMSPAHFSRQFHRAAGLSPYGYVLERRLQAAHHRLEQGIDIASAALDAGFSSQSHFTTQFRRRYGTTPGRMLRRQ